MPNLQFRLFGKFTAHRDAQVLKGLEASKDQELLGYLLLNRDRHHSREALAALLWGDIPTERSKKYLRQALWHLQTVLETGAGGQTPCILVDHEWLKLNPNNNLWTDVAEFEGAFAGVEGIPGTQLDSQSAQALKNAVSLYQGDLLAGWYQDWCLFERERLQNIYLLMLDKLINYSEQHQQYEIAQGYAITILRYDPARERTHRQLMNLHYLSGDRTSALRQYDRCVAALKQELEVRPERRTVSLYERIRADQLGTSPVKDAPEPNQQRNVVSPDVIGRLKRLQVILSAVQRRIQRDIKAVESGPHRKG